VHGRPPGLSREYWKDPAATARTRRGIGTYRRPRLARRDGYFWFVGRDDDVIISAGYRIGPFEVESALIEHPRWSRPRRGGARSRPRIDREGVRRVRDGYTPSDALARELQDHVKRVTAPYKYPRAIEFAKELPKTVSGKIRAWSCGSARRASLVRSPN
jgi:acetyl-CoA synthetase/medium-chain acyl-CoA synthetase